MSWPRWLSCVILIPLAFIVAGVSQTGRALPVAPAVAPRAGPTAGQSSGDILLSVSPESDRYPMAAFNAADGEFLVVWAASLTLLAQRVGRSGEPIGDSLEIANRADWSGKPAVAYASGPGRYLVVWEDREGGDFHIYGQLVERDGRLALGRLTIYDGPGRQYAPAIAASDTGFLVAWYDTNPAGRPQIAARPVSGAGGLGDRLVITSGDGEVHSDPAVAYEPLSREFTVLYRYGSDAHAVVRAQRVAAGALVGPYHTVSSGSPATALGVSAGTANDRGYWLVVWTANEGAVTRVYGCFVLSGRDVTTRGPQFVIHEDAGALARPRVAWLPTAARYVVLWEQTDPADPESGALQAQVLDADGVSVGDPFDVGAAARMPQYGALAVGDDPEQALIAWEDHGDNGPNIVAQAVDAAGARLWGEVTVSAAPGTQAAPAAAYDPHDKLFLAVWQDEGGAGTDIVGLRLTTVGTAFEVPWTMHQDGHDNVEPTVTYSEQTGTHVVLWADTAGGIEGCQVLRGTQDCGYFAIPDSLGGRRPRLACPATGSTCVAVWDAHGDVFSSQVRFRGQPAGSATVAVASGTLQQDQPVLALDTTRSRYLLVWHQTSGLAQALMGRFLDDLGHPVGDPLVLTTGDQATPRRDPTVAYDARTDSFLVAYVCDLKQADGDIRAVQVPGTGSPVGVEAIVRAQPEAADQAGPQLTYVPSSGLFHAVWSERWPSPGGDANGWDLFGRWLRPTGANVGAVLGIVRYPGDQRQVRTAVDADHQGLLLLWRDGRRGEVDDIYARVDSLDTDPPTARFTVDPSVGRAGSAFAFDARASRDAGTPGGALTVRWDWTTDGTFDTQWSTTKVITRTINVAGTYTVTLEVRDTVGLTATTAHPVRVVAAPANQPPVARLAVTPGTGVAGTEWALDASASSDAETPPADLEVRWDLGNDGEFDTPWSKVHQSRWTVTRAGPAAVAVEARDAGGLTDVESATFTVTSGPTTVVEVHPPRVTLNPGGKALFYSVTWDAYGNLTSNNNVVWSVTDPRAGAIDALGRFTAGTVPGDYPDVVRAVAGGTAADTASVAIVEVSTPTPTPTATATATPGRSPTPTATQSATRVATATPSTTRIATATLTTTPGPSASPFPSATATPSATRRPTVVATVTPRPSTSPAPSPTATPLATLGPGTKVYLPVAYDPGP
jgi:hypothetical protein